MQTHARVPERQINGVDKLTSVRLYVHVHLESTSTPADCLMRLSSGKLCACIRVQRTKRPTAASL